MYSGMPVDEEGRLCIEKNLFVMLYRVLCSELIEKNRLEGSSYKLH